MKKYIGTDITPEGLQRLTNRLTSPLKLPRTIKMRDIQAVYGLMANVAFSPKDAAQMLPQLTLKKIRTCIHLMLRYNMLRPYKGK